MWAARPQKEQVGYVSSAGLLVCSVLLCRLGGGGCGVSRVGDTSWVWSSVVRSVQDRLSCFRADECVTWQAAVCLESLGSVEMSFLSSENISCFFKSNSVTRGVTCCTPQGFKVGGAPPWGMFVFTYTVCGITLLCPVDHRQNQKPLNVLGQNVVMYFVLHEVKSVGNTRLLLLSIKRQLQPEK